MAIKLNWETSMERDLLRTGGRWEGGEPYDDKVEVGHWVEQGADYFHEQVVKALRNVHDPEIPLNIYDLGLIYQVETAADGAVLVTMTLTSPSCPEAEAIPGRVESEVMSVPGASSVEVVMEWDPPWDPERMSEEARLELGFY